MFFCFGRPAAESLLPPGLEPERPTKFDRDLVEGFRKMLDRGDVIRVDFKHPERVKRRILIGNFQALVGNSAVESTRNGGVVLQLSPDLSAKKWRPEKKEGVEAQVMAPVDPEAFNFTKVAGERICTLDAVGGVRVAVFAHAFPLCFSHVLLLPYFEAVLPQVMTEDLMLCGLQILTSSGTHDFRVLFSSQLAGEQVNHFHFHGVYGHNLYCLSSKRLPIEWAPRSNIAGDTTEGNICVEMILETRWLARGFVVSAGCKTGCTSTEAFPPADLKALASAAFRIVSELQQRNIPHHVVFVPWLGKPKESKQFGATVDENRLEEAEQKPAAASPEIFIIPRQAEGNLRDDVAFNASVWEVVGIINVHTEEAFNGLNQETVKEIFWKDVSYNSVDFEALIIKAAWMAMP